ncbi:unnamed protein product [Effrenium voratum]|uniref:Rab-GAP TBC domain-containing protein n=1 Tax=Effrenium voratum TaxID=2562239 RepID=A0AA36NI06_9DINO|nr:unnamed protein product [Effrenium voratum]
MAAKHDQDIFKAFDEETDAFFDSLMSEGPAAAPEPTAAFDPPARTEAKPASTEASIDHKFDEEGSKATSTQEGSESAARFRIDSDGSDEPAEGPPSDLAQEHLQMAPLPPADFSSEDRALHEALEDFYWRNRATNLSNINSIVVKYRGANVPHLWAQLALKYNVPPVEGVEFLGRTLYQSAPFEYSGKELRLELDEAVSQVRKEALAEGLSPSRAELLGRAISRGAKDGRDHLLRLLTFRGLPDDANLRAQVWKVLLGYLPMKRHDEWNAIQGEKRALYASYRSELLAVNSAYEVSVSNRPQSPGSEIEDEELLQEIKNDVERTRRDFEYFRRPSTKAALVAMLFVYAKLNPGVRYVQGMNEIAAVLLYVMSVDLECAEALHEGFGCDDRRLSSTASGSALLEIKDGFMQALDHSGEGVYGMVDEITRLLRSYDPVLARHLQKAELSLFVFVLRWCTVLFAQDATLPDVLRLWDSFIADPERYGFVVHTCVAVILGKRDMLLSTDKQFSLAEIIQAGPRGTDFDELLRRANAICAFERRGSQPPIFPPKRLQVMDDLNEWAHTAAVAASEAAAVASGVGAEVSKNIQEKLAPVVLERAGQASEVVQDKAQALQSWLHDTAPARREALEQAQTQLSSLWSSVRTKGQQFASEAATSETVGSAAARFSSAAESASGFFARASMAFAEAPQAQPQQRPAGDT